VRFQLFSSWFRKLKILGSRISRTLSSREKCGGEFRLDDTDLIFFLGIMNQVCELHFFNSLSSLVWIFSTKTNYFPVADLNCVSCVWVSTRRCANKDIYCILFLLLHTYHAYLSWNSKFHSWDYDISVWCTRDESKEKLHSCKLNVSVYNSVTTTISPNWEEKSCSLVVPYTNTMSAEISN